MSDTELIVDSAFAAAITVASLVVYWKGGIIKQSMSETVGLPICAILNAALFGIPLYVIIHFVVKYW